MRLSLPAWHSFLSPPTCARIVTFVEVQASGRSRRMRMVLRLIHEFRFFVQVSQLPSTLRLHTMKNTEVTTSISLLGYIIVLLLTIENNYLQCRHPNRVRPVKSSWIMPLYVHATRTPHINPSTILLYTILRSLDVIDKRK